MSTSQTKGENACTALGTNTWNVADTSERILCKSGAPSSQSKGSPPRGESGLPPKTPGKPGLSSPRFPSPALTWVAKVKFIVRVTVDFGRGQRFHGCSGQRPQEDGGSALEEEAEQGQFAVAGPRSIRGDQAMGQRLQSPTRLWLRARGESRHSRGGDKGRQGPY